MSGLDWGLLALIALALFFAIRSARRSKGCSGDCSRCSGCGHGKKE